MVRAGDCADRGGRMPASPTKLNGQVAVTFGTGALEVFGGILIPELKAKVSSIGNDRG
jgi:hypothetical protein